MNHNTVTCLVYIFWLLFKNIFFSTDPWRKEPLQKSGAQLQVSLKVMATRGQTQMGLRILCFSYIFNYFS